MIHDSFEQFCNLQNRRQFVKQAGIGLGAAAVSSMALPASAALPAGCHQDAVKGIVPRRLAAFKRDLEANL